MATSQVSLVPLYREMCLECGQWSEFLIHVGSETRNDKGDLLAVVVRCGNCDLDREILRRDDWR